MPPGSALDHLDGALRRLRDRPGAPRWVGRDLQHVTLAFFGEVPEATVPALTAAVGDALAVAEVHLRLTGAGTFPAKGDPRVLWVGVDGDVEELAELAAAAAEAGRSVGVPIERRAYRPHVTVGRWAHSAARGPGGSPPRWATTPGRTSPPARSCSCAATTARPRGTRPSRRGAERRATRWGRATRRPAEDRVYQA